jgi:hypothetical protein
MVRRYTHKGVRDDSTWTRPQAWAMVGYAVMHLWTREREFLDVAMHTADWWLAHAPVDLVAFCDFDAPAGPDTNRDTSGTAIAAAALLKLAALAPEETQRARYQAAAEATGTALVELYLNARAGSYPSHARDTVRCSCGSQRGEDTSGQRFSLAAAVGVVGGLRAPGRDCQAGQHRRGP